MRHGHSPERGHLGLLKTRPGLITELCRVLRTLHPLFARPGGLFCYVYVAPVGKGENALQIVFYRELGNTEFLIINQYCILQYAILPAILEP